MLPGLMRLSGCSEEGVLENSILLKEGARSIKEIAKNLWKNINWLSVAKQVGSIGFSLATGIFIAGMIPDKVVKMI